MSQRALLGREEATAREIIRLERELCDPLCDAIERFVDGVILEGGIDSLERRRCFQLKNVNVDLERVGDHAENLAEATQDRIYHDVPFSPEADVELARLFEQTQLSLKTALAAFRAGDAELARQALRLEDEMDRLTLSVREGHVRRVGLGLCHPEADVIFVETIRNLERISDHADNIAVSVLERV
jgi:phosphate:Na+ symporter